MDQISARTWTVIGVIGLILFASNWLRVSHRMDPWAPASASFTYEMPRPKSIFHTFSLADYQVERVIQKLPDVQPPPKVTVAPPQKLDPKKVAEDKLAAQKKVAMNQAIAQRAKSLIEARRKKMQVTNTDTSRAQTMSGAGMQVTDTSREMPNFADPMARVDAKMGANAEQKDEDEEDKEKLTLAQWRSLLQTAPTPANVAKFVAARRSGDLEANGYYRIIHELLIDSASDRKSAGLAILDRDVSASTFAFLVTEQSSNQMPADVKSSLKTRADSYSEPTKVTQLGAVLMSSNSPEVVTAALQRIMVAYTRFRQVAGNGSQGGPGSGAGGEIGSGGGGIGNGSGPGNGGGNSSSAAGKYTAQQFLSFLSGLQKVSKATGAAQGQASQLLAQIQALRPMGSSTLPRVASGGNGPSAPN